MLYSSRDKLAMDLCYLVKEDHQLLNDIIYNYCQLINNKQFNDLEDVVNNEIRSIIWSFFITIHPLITMNIVTTIRPAFGTDHEYIVDKDIAASVQQLTGKKTVSLCDLEALKALGHTINNSSQ